VLTSGRQLITILPPTSSLLLILVLMVMLLFPTRQALRVALLAWLLVAWPVLIYLLLHPLEMETPRGRNLPMAYGTALVLIAVLIPVQRGLAGKIERLTSERARLAAFGGASSTPVSLGNLIERMERGEFDLIAVGRALLTMRSD